MRRPLLVLVLLSATLAGCADTAEPPAASPTPTTPATATPTATPAPTPEEGPVVRGLVTRANGTPIEGARVIVEGTTDRNERKTHEATTDAAGRYAVRVANGSYAAFARLDVDHDGQRFTFDLAPTDANATRERPVGDALVRDFVWRTSGMREGKTDALDPTSYWGTSVLVGEPFHYALAKGESTWNAREMPEGAVTVITLTPVAPLVDGSAGAPVRGEVTWPVERLEARYVVDVPVGRYVASGVIHLPDGTERPLLLSSATHMPGDSPEPGEPAEEVPIWFLAHEAPSRGATEAKLYIVDW